MGRRKSSRPKRLTDEEILLALADSDGHKAKTAELLGITERQVYRRLQDIAKKTEATEAQREFTVSDIPPSGVSAPDLWGRRIQDFRIKARHEEAAKLRKVKVNIDGPVGILFFGDPHVDDDGTDLAALERDCKLVRETEGLFGGGIGDYQNNWIHSLKRLYAEQGTSAEQSWQLAEYFLHFCPGKDPADLTPKERRAYMSKWLFLLAGNHDLWSGAGDPIKWIARLGDTEYSPSQFRFVLKFSRGQDITVNARHDFKGYSIYNQAHGQMRTAQMEYPDHILISGHRHVSGYGMVRNPASGVISHAIQIASYKRYDAYARDKGLPPRSFSECCVTVINPEAKREAGLVSVHFDPEEGADYLTFLRNRRK